MADRHNPELRGGGFDSPAAEANGRLFSAIA